MNDTQQTQLFIAIVFIILCCFIGFVIDIYTFYQLCIQDSSTWINSIYRNLTIAIIIMYTFSSIADIIHIILQYPPNIIKDTENLICLNASNVFYFTGNIMFYILITLRIYFPFQLNKCIAYSLSFIIFISGIISILYIIFSWPYFQQYNNFWKVIIVTLSADDLILGLFIFIIFIHKMRKTVSKIDPLMSDIAAQNVDLMTNVMIKHSILFGVVLIMNQGFFVCHLYQTFAQDYNFLVDKCITYSIRAIENLAVIVALWLLLQNNYSKYIRLCKCCHLVMSKCCFKTYDNSVFNPYTRMYDL
eukprot:340251_1